MENYLENLALWSRAGILITFEKKMYAWAREYSLKKAEYLASLTIFFSPHHWDDSWRKTLWDAL